MGECQHLPAHNRGKACAACLRHWRERAEKAEAERDRLAAVVEVARWERDSGLASPHLCRALAAIEANGGGDEC